MLSNRFQLTSLMVTNYNGPKYIWSRQWCQLSYVHEKQWCCLYDATSSFSQQFDGTTSGQSFLHENVPNEGEWNANISIKTKWQSWPLKIILCVASKLRNTTSCSVLILLLHLRRRLIRSSIDYFIYSFGICDQVIIWNGGAVWFFLYMRCVNSLNALTIAVMISTVFNKLINEHGHWALSNGQYSFFIEWMQSCVQIILHARAAAAITAQWVTLCGTYSKTEITMQIIIIIYHPVCVEMHIVNGK